MTPHEVVRAWIAEHNDDPNPDEATDGILAALKAEGWAIVPRIATPEMFDGLDALPYTADRGEAEDYWKAMLEEWERTNA